MFGRAVRRTQVDAVDFDFPFAPGPAAAAAAAFLTLGRAVQVEPMKPMLKAPVSKRLKLKYGATAFKSCFQFQLAPLNIGDAAMDPFERDAATAGAAREVGRCRLTVLQPELKARLVSALETEMR